MTIPPDLNPAVFVVHAVLGLTTVLFVLGALFTAKGSTIHRRSGQAFAIAMGIAAVTALVFMASRPSNYAIASALFALYGLGTGYLTLKPRRGVLRALELGLFVIPWLALLFFALVGITLLTTPNQAPPTAMPAAFAIAAFAAYLAIKDVAYVRSRETTRPQRLRRHAIRFGVAAAEVVRAPLITFAPRIFGDVSLDLYFLAPLLLVPAIYLLARPSWLPMERDERRMAANAA